MQDPPALPKQLIDVRGFVAVGTLLWLLAAAGLFLAHLVTDRPLDIVFVTCVVGGALGFVGFAIMGWQRSALRRGSRGAQRGID